ncbi:hypothetical protein T492DRAFT_974360 [Pavlovales sp. CCMP2436]|nr:hypothetical protein T492DRAFT_974360 [Pavlovales sp. CCMP2436]
MCNFTAQGLANTAWAFAVVSVATRGALEKAVNARAAAIGFAALSLAERTQLHQFFLSVELELRLPAKLLAPIGLWDACKQAMADEPTASSKLHLEVSAELTRMGIEHANELCVPKLGYHVDIAILPITDTAEAGPLLDEKMSARAREAARAATVTYGGLVIEVDGPWHYDAARRLLPATALIQHHLALVGCALSRCRPGNGTRSRVTLKRQLISPSCSPRSRRVRRAGLLKAGDCILGRGVFLTSYVCMISYFCDCVILDRGVFTKHILALSVR